MSVEWEPVMAFSDIVENLKLDERSHLACGHEGAKVFYTPMHVLGGHTRGGSTCPGACTVVPEGRARSIIADGSGWR
jgi:hypothetical protein